MGSITNLEDMLMIRMVRTDLDWCYDRLICLDIHAL